MNTLSVSVKRIVVEMVDGSDRPKGPPGPKGLQARRASRPKDKGTPGPKGLQAQRATRPEGPPGSFAVLPF